MGDRGVMGGTGNMPIKSKIFGLLALTLAISAGFLTPVSAEVSSYTREFAAQSVRPRITIHPRHRPGRYSTRYCRSWLAREYRVSGPVIVPQMRCFWN
jgi:hypothetical protein